MNVAVILARSGSKRIKKKMLNYLKINQLSIGQYKTYLNQKNFQKLLSPQMTKKSQKL